MDRGFSSQGLGRMPFKIKTFDLSLIIIPIIFLLISVSVIYSLVLGTSNDGLATKQAIIGVIGLGLLFLFSFLDYRFLKGTAWIFYLFSVVLLVLVIFIGKTTNGAENWIDLKVFQLQPSEVAKFFLIVTFAAIFSGKIGKIRWRDIVWSMFLLIVPLGLIIKEPDIGTALIIIFIYFTMLIMAKPSKSQLAVIFSIIGVLIIASTLAYKNVKPFGGMLADYQRQRIAVFLNPSLDPYGRGYNVKQAQITVGSGGIIGKGLGKGSQSQLQFLPEPHTDFIFAGIVESFGFLGSLVLLAMYCYFLVRLVEIGNLARDNFGMLMVYGIAAMFLLQVVENVGMNLGLLPVTGIPLPLLSYGGTSLLISLFSIGVVQSIIIRHKKINF